MAWMRRVFGGTCFRNTDGADSRLVHLLDELMSIALVWQAQVIAKQHAVINMLETKFGG